MKKMIIIGQMEQENHLSGPGAVIKSLIKGLEEEKIEYCFINTYIEKKRETFPLLFKILSLLFVSNRKINVHTFGYKIPYLVMLISKLNKRNDYYLTIHGIASYEFYLNNGKEISKKIINREKKILHNYQNIICVSNFLKDIIKEQFGIEKNVFVISNGLEKVNKIKPLKKGEQFIYAGGFSKRKNPLDVIKLFSTIKENSKTSKLIICGPNHDEELYNECIDYIKSNHIDGIEICGKLTKEELYQKYAQSKYIIALSEFDTFNMTILEAMNYYCIPIISKNCGIKEILENKCGIIYENNEDTVKKIKSINFEQESNLSYSLSIKNTYLDMTRKYNELMGVKK